jgi:hypothetical protein
MMNPRRPRHPTTSIPRISATHHRTRTLHHRTTLELRRLLPRSLRLLLLPHHRPAARRAKSRATLSALALRQMGLHHSSARPSTGIHRWLRWLWPARPAPHSHRLHRLH